MAVSPPTRKWKRRRRERWGKWESRRHFAPSCCFLKRRRGHPSAFPRPTPLKRLHGGVADESITEVFGRAPQLMRAVGEAATRRVRTPPRRKVVSTKTGFVTARRKLQLEVEIAFDLREACTEAFGLAICAGLTIRHRGLFGEVHHRGCLDHRKMDLYI
ncbi:unnamed protein product [Phytomonas sp. EM1]|nr:unnamed protein product [Phytomonas sp. EM1]|eukprot:CCW64878.1 unnamed protein product [Phytomonas sp. isolate EM1]